MKGSPKFHNLWRWKCGMPEEGDKPSTPMPSLAFLRKSEWSGSFEQLMRDRLIMGAFRYGRLGDKSKPKYDRMDSIIRRAQIYKETGDVGLLADIANLALCEYVEGDHPNKCLKMGDSTEHVKITN